MYSLSLLVFCLYICSSLSEASTTSMYKGMRCGLLGMAFNVCKKDVCPHLGFMAMTYSPLNHGT